MKLGTQSAPAYRVFSIEELGEATDNFDPLAYLGESPLGKVLLEMLFYFLNRPFLLTSIWKIYY